MDSQKELLANAGYRYEPERNQWMDGDTIIEYRDGKWCFILPFDVPMHGEGDDLMEMMTSAQQNLKTLYHYNKRLLKLISSHFNED